MGRLPLAGDCAPSTPVPLSHSDIQSRLTRPLDTSSQTACARLSYPDGGPSIFPLTSVSPRMNFDFSKSDQSMLTWAINIVLTAPDLPPESCIAIQSKLNSVSDAHQTAADVKTIQNIALTTVKQAGAWQLWTRIKKPLSAWEHAFKNSQRNCSKQNLSRPAREAVQHAKTSFDVTTLPSEQLDFLFLLAYAGIGPCSLERFTELYGQCSSYSSTGAEVRNQVEKYLAKDKVLYRLQRNQALTGKKRETEEMCTVIEKEKNGDYRKDCSFQAMYKKFTILRDEEKTSTGTISIFDTSIDV